MAVVQADKPPEELVAGKYRLTRLLGRGGMGSVWEGVHTSLGTHVAVKFIESEYVTSSEARSRFANEARAAAKLRSKHVVQVYDHGVTDDGRPFIVMEFLAGEPLDRRLDRVGRLAPVDTARILHQVCRALGRAHEAGIVHRDLKPENIFLVWDEEDGADVVKVVDFGIAKFTDGTMAVSSATRTGSVLGTPYYMSPEQARGLRSVDHRSDLWSVGVIAYRCLVGELPFQGEAIGDLLVKICTAPIPVPSREAPGIPPAFDAWFATVLDREPSQRFASAQATSEALSVALGQAAPRVPMQSASGSHHYASAATPGLTTPMQHFARTPPTQTDAQRSGGVQPTAAMTTPHTGQVPQHYQSHMDRGVGQDPRDMTAAPLTATPTQLKRTGRGPLVAAAAVAVIVLGIGVALAVKFVGRGADPQPVTEPSIAATQPSAAAASAADPGPAVAPAVTPAQATTAGAVPSSSASSSHVASASTPGTPGTPGKPAASARADVKRAPPAARAPQSKPRLPTAPAQGPIDLGY